MQRCCSTCPSRKKQRPTDSSSRSRRLCRSEPGCLSTALRLLANSCCCSSASSLRLRTRAEALRTPEQLRQSSWPPPSLAARHQDQSRPGSSDGYCRGPESRPLRPPRGKQDCARLREGIKRDQRLRAKCIHLLGIAINCPSPIGGAPPSTSRRIARGSPGQPPRAPSHGGGKSAMAYPRLLSRDQSDAGGYT